MLSQEGAPQTSNYREFNQGPPGCCILKSIITCAQGPCPQTDNDQCAGILRKPIPRRHRDPLTDDSGFRTP